MSTSNRKLRRLAPRAKRISVRHGDRAPALAAYVDSIPPACDSFVATYDALDQANARQSVELGQSSQVSLELYKSLKAWGGQLVAAAVIDGFSAADYGKRPEVADDVVADSERVVGIVQQHVAEYPESLPFADALIADLTAGIEKVNKERAEAEQAKSEYILLVNQNRENAEVLSRLLIGFRRSLAAVIGRNHPDYQALRAAKVDREDPRDPDQDPDQDDAQPDDPELADVG